MLKSITHTHVLQVEVDADNHLLVHWRAPTNEQLVNHYAVYYRVVGDTRANMTRMVGILVDTQNVAHIHTIVEENTARKNAHQADRHGAGQDVRSVRCCRRQ